VESGDRDSYHSKDNYHNLGFVLTKHFSGCIFCTAKRGGGWRDRLRCPLVLNRENSSLMNPKYLNVTGR